MADEEETVITPRAAPGGGDSSDPRDDWLAAGDLEWFPEDGNESGAAPRVPGRGRSEDAPASPPTEGVFRRRREVAAVVAVLVVVAVVIIAIVALGGTGGSNTPATTAATTTPPVTTTPAVTTTTTPGTTTTTTTQTTTETGTPTQVTLPAAGHLKPGDTGAEVETLQRALVAIGAGSLTVDGTYGPATQQVVTAFQTANGLTADGIVGAQTAAAINAALAAQG